jgi:hypothetical protein
MLEDSQMSKSIHALTLASALAATMCAAPAFAQTTTQKPDAPAVTEPSTTAPPADMKAPSPSTTSPSTSTTTAASGAPMMTDDEAKKWIDKTVYSSDGKNLGEVAQILRDNTGHVTELHADIGGFLGIGETRVKLLPSEFKLGSDRVVLNLSSEDAKKLPHLPK